MNSIYSVVYHLPEEEAAEIGSSPYKNNGKNGFPDSFRFLKRILIIN